MFNLIHRALLRDLRTTEYTVRITDPANRPSRPVRIALLADLHDCVAGSDRDALPAAIEAAGVDLVLCAGDMVTAKAGFGHTREGLALLHKLCRDYPVYLADGNHESRLRLYREAYPGQYRHYLKELADMGAVLLNNRSRMIKVGGMRLCLSGFVQDLVKYNRAHPGIVTADELRQTLGEPAKGYRILIAHSPDHFQAYADWGADLTVSGHLHGGIIRLPVLGGVLGGSYRPFPRYDKGMFTLRGVDDREHAMIVSAGLGAHSVAFRINNPPELVVITLEGT